MAGLTRRNSKSIFIPPESDAEANQRRAYAVKRLAEVKFELTQLHEEEENLKAEIKGVNLKLRSIT
jgi:hypothetical protein